MYLVDSDWIIDGLAGLPAVLERLDRHNDDGLAVSIISYGEIFEGAFHSSDPEIHLAMFRRFLSGFNVLGLDVSVMEVFARTRAQLRRQGNLIPDMDLLIAATALSYDLILMTNNRRHFTRVPDLRLYQP